MYFLQKYIGGAAKEAVDGYFLTDTEESYFSAWSLLDERYGDPFIVAKAYRDKLYSWPKITPKDGVELRKFVDFLRSCDSAIAHNRHLRILDDAMENQMLATKLPDWLITGWNRAATTYQLEHGHFPNFTYFVTYLNLEASIACNPITSYSALQQRDYDRNKPRNPTANAKTFNTTTERQPISCHLCQKPGHGLSNCHNFIAKPLDDRVKYILTERLCFGCLRFGHISKNCRNKMICDICHKRHPTCIHNDRPFEPKKESSEDQGPTPQIQTNAMITHCVVQKGTSNQTSPIIPVYISTPEHDQEVLVYAMLDTQSDSSFILEEVAETLDVVAEPVKLKLSTMSSKGTTVSCKRLKQLQVRGFFSDKKVTVPTMYTRKFIPANRAHIPTPETVKSWPHLQHLSKHIAPYQDCKIALVIGYNCPLALMPREAVCGEGNQPFAQRTDLGWSVISYAEPYEYSDEATGLSHCITIQQVTPELNQNVKMKCEVHCDCKDQRIAPDHINAIPKSGGDGRDVMTSQEEELKGLPKLKEKTKHGHQLPLLFKWESPNLGTFLIPFLYFSLFIPIFVFNVMKYTFFYDDAGKVLKDRLPDAEVSEEHLHFIGLHIPMFGNDQPKGKRLKLCVYASKCSKISLNDSLTHQELTAYLVGVQA